MNGKFDKETNATISADFLSKKYTFNGKNYNCQLWDTAGQEKFKAMNAAFYRKSDCCVIVYDVTDKKVSWDLIGSILRATKM